MEVELTLFLYFINFLFFVQCPYPPTGDEVMPGSVLLPATRRGRYLANIVRRQAVDGTGIKFNKDADRMNAEAKKKVDVLSDELLPYIIAEQERRTTLYKRIMTAIQNGEKGVTIAEIRNKPPLIIRKGLMYRCPANRAPKEPDGSGTLMCDDEIEPTQVMYDSCLSAEDKELYVAENRYFFCNRHKIEGPDLPRNGTTVIGCAPIERTSHNYTTSKCTLEDTDDVVVHYRYYPDRTYKFVTELDPDHEVCDHWNPCQIGYIYSLPSPDQAVMANELWRGYAERVDDYERDEIIPAIPEDSVEEFVHQAAVNYTASPRRVRIPSGWTFQKLWAKRNVDNYGWNPSRNRWNSRSDILDEGRSLSVSLMFPETFSEFFYSAYYAVFAKGKALKSEKFLVIMPSSAYVLPQSIHSFHGARINTTLIPYRCHHCRLQGLMVRSPDGHVQNLDSSKFKIREHADRQGKVQQYLGVQLDELKPQDFGDYFAIIANSDGVEERVKVLTVQAPRPDLDGIVKVDRVVATLEIGAHFDRTMQFECDDCELVDVMCNGESAMSAGRVAVIPISKLITFNFPRFEDSNSCVYMGLFKSKDHIYSKTLAIVSNAATPAGLTIGPPKVIAPPQIGDQFEFEVPYTCSDCIVEKVNVNGIPLETSFRRSGPTGSIGFYVLTPTGLAIRITEFTLTYEGVYQGVFNVNGETVTKTILEIGPCDNKLEDTPVEDKCATTPSGDAAKDGEKKDGDEKKGDDTDKKDASPEKKDDPNPDKKDEPDPNKKDDADPKKDDADPKKDETDPNKKPDE